MKAIKCEMCGSNKLLKENGVYVCQMCGTQYTVEEAKKLMIEGTVDVSGSTVKIDKAPDVENYLENARIARTKKDWKSVEKYYKLVEENQPKNIEALFWGGYGKMRQICLLRLSDDNYSYETFKNERQVFCNTIALLADYFDFNNEPEQRVVITEAMLEIIKVRDPKTNQINGVDIYDFSNPYWESRKMLEKLIEKYRQKNLDSSYLEELKVKAMSSLPKTKSGCYVATCVYGSYDCPQVWTLRRYRDYSLAKTWYGRAFIRTYYAISPTIVKWFGNTSWFKGLWKKKLDKMVLKLQDDGFENTPYNDIDWQKRG